MIMFNHKCEKGQHPFNEQYIYSFENGYGASVVRGLHTYGGDKGLWELAVLDSDGHITYDTPITRDVIGYMSETDVEETLNRIRDLKSIRKEG